MIRQAALLLAALAAFLLAPMAALAQGVPAPVTSTITTASASSTFTPMLNRTFHIQLTGTASANCYLERELDGTNWVPVTVTAAGTIVILFSWTYASAALSEDQLESQPNIPYRVDCGALLGSFTSGSLNVRFSQ